jgi:hypothetical protein
MKKLIKLLESLTNKKVILEDSVFKSRKLDERLLPIKKELEKHMTIDESNKSIIIKNYLFYVDCLVLEKFYQGYSVDVNGNVELSNEKLEKLPNINFNKINGNVDLACNRLTSLEHCPKEVSGYFNCTFNKNRFTKKDVLKVCNVNNEKILTDSVQL